MRSSYFENHYDVAFKMMVFSIAPKIAVEIGVLDGYSTIAICKGLKETENLKGTMGHLDSFDLWEDYKFNHGNIQKVSEKIQSLGLEKYVTLYKEDAFNVHRRYENGSVDFLHIDISNDGDIITRMVELWTPKVKHRGLFVFEGGSEERDNIDWMKKYSKSPIRPVLNHDKIINENYVYGTYEDFPSLTVMKKITI